MTWLTDPFASDFMLRALLGGVLVSSICALVGTWVVIRGMAFLGEAENSRILRHCVSPNGQFAAVETIGASSTPDKYPGAPGFTNTLTYIVEIDSARVVSGLNGGFSDWCGG